MPWTTAAGTTSSTRKSQGGSGECEGGEGGECEEGLEGWRCVAGSGFRVQGSGLNLKWLVQGSGLRTLGPNGWFRAQG